MWWGCLEGAGVLVVGVVFGALLGPEATGPSRSFLRGDTFLVFLCFPAAVSLSHGYPCFFCGVVWWGWLLGLLFENYIVDASIWTHAPVGCVCS